eukprot:Gb_35966 [translate_table: standard]
MEIISCGFVLFLTTALLGKLPVQILANSEGDALYAFKSALDDPENALASWDTSLVNPCTWVYITCNIDNSVVRIDLGNKRLSGPLSPKISKLQNLQYLELFKNQFNGSIPRSWGGLKKLVSLDLYINSLSGAIPNTLGQLSGLVFLRLNNNRLSGRIPDSLTSISSLDVLDVSYNKLSGPVHTNGSFSKFTSESFRGNPRLCGNVVGKPC